MFGKSKWGGGGFGRGAGGFARGGGNCGGPGGWGGPGGGGPLAMLRGLDLTDEQVLKLAEIKGGAFFKMAHNKIDMMHLKKQIFKELLASPVDKAKVRELANQIKEKKSLCMEEMLENVIAVSELLTAEQKHQLKLQKIRCMLGLGGHHDHDEHDDEGDE